MGQLTRIQVTTLNVEYFGREFFAVEAHLLMTSIIGQLTPKNRPTDVASDAVRQNSVIWQIEQTLIVPNCIHFEKCKQEKFNQNLM